MDQVDLLKNDSYLIGPCEKNVIDKYARNVNMNLQWKRFPNLSTQNNSKRVEMSLKSIFNY